MDQRNRTSVGKASIRSSFSYVRYVSLAICYLSPYNNAYMQENSPYGERKNGSTSHITDKVCELEVLQSNLI